MPPPTWQLVEHGRSQPSNIPGLRAGENALVDVVVAEPSGTLWMARPGKLLCCTAGEAKQIDASLAWGDSAVRTILSDGRGGVWVVSYGTNQLHHYANGSFKMFGKVDGIAGAEDVRCVYPDREGNTWVGTGGAGLYRIQPRQMLSLLAGSEPLMEEFYSIAPGRDGRVWLAASYGPIKYQDGNFSVITNQQAFGNGNINRTRLVFEHSSAEVLAALDFEGLQRVRDAALEPVDCLPKMEIKDRRSVTSIAEGPDGTLWIATARGLAARKDGHCKTWSTADGLSDKATFGLVCLTNGDVWVGTKSGGVNEFKHGRFRTFKTEHGLLHNNAWPLRAQEDGSVWVGTPVGLHRISNGTVKSVTNYGEADGMPSVEGNGDQQPNAAVLPNGELWFPMTRGVVVVDPKNIRDNTVKPQVVIEEVLVDRARVYRDGGYIFPPGFRRLENGSIRLPPGRARVLEVTFTATTFMDSEKTTFRCRLGSGEEWRDLDTRRTAVFTNLKPGSYRFEVEASNSHGLKGARAAEFSFALAPHFYETWPFYGCVVLGTAGVIGTWQVRRTRMRRRLQRLQRDRAVESERNRIARDLHDDLGSNLTGLAIQLDVALHELNSPTVLGTHLQVLSQTARNLVDVMRDVVWSVNPQCDTVESFCSYVCQYAEKFARAVGLVCRFDLPESMPEVTLTSEVRHHLLMTIKEALTNVAKHASATQVQLGVQLEGKNMIVAITDNGRGCVNGQQEQDGSNERASKSANGGPAGNGLRNMRQRLGLLRGNMEFISSPGVGTTVRLQIPISTKDLELN